VSKYLTLILGIVAGVTVYKVAVQPMLDGMTKGA
jgi:hypothetical protein